MHKDIESGCKIIMPLFDFINKDGCEYAFIDGRYKLQQFNPTDELTKEKILSEQDQRHISFESWAIVVENAEKYNYKAEVNLLLLAFRLAKKCRAFIKFRLSPNCKTRVTRLCNTFKFTLRADTTRVMEKSDFDNAGQTLIKLIDMTDISPRTYNAILFLCNAYQSHTWISAFIYYMMCLESLFSKEAKGDSERTICLRVSAFYMTNMGQAMMTYNLYMNYGQSWFMVRLV